MGDDYVFTEADAAQSAADQEPNSDPPASSSREVVNDDRGVIVPNHTLWVGNIPANVNSEQIAAVLCRGHAQGTVLQIEVSDAHCVAQAARFEKSLCALCSFSAARPGHQMQPLHWLHVQLQLQHTW